MTIFFIKMYWLTDWVKKYSLYFEKTNYLKNFLEYLFFQIHSIHLHSTNRVKCKDEYNFSKYILVAILTTPVVVRSSLM
ncbi:hypothetical protein DW107_00390 [Tannerella sp. AM09-19]|nr:hypothetical protein DW107_00390 [Tannerella sp. AM09-19]